MPADRRIPRLALIVAAAGVLCGCPSLSQRTEAPPSVDRAVALDNSGDHAGAARMYEALAAQNQGAGRNDYLLRAARAYLAAQRPDDAVRVLAQTAAPMTVDQENERALRIGAAATNRLIAMVVDTIKSQQNATRGYGASRTPSRTAPMAPVAVNRRA